jgi:hypothetical protein
MWSCFGAGSAGRPGHVARQVFRPSSEPLEDRKLLSFSLFSILAPTGPAAKPPLSPAVVSGQLPKNVSGRIAGLYELSLTKHTLYQSISGSHVLKSPMFNADYTGAKLADLDVIAATADVSAQQVIQFRGEVLGPVNIADRGVYSFLVNRGGASAPGPFKGRTAIAFDAIVQVSTSKGGFTGKVVLLGKGGTVASTTDLPAGSVQISSNTVKAEVPLSLLPSSDAAPARTRQTTVTFTFAANSSGNLASDVAGFAPEYTMIPIGPSLRRRA